MKKAWESTMKLKTSSPFPHYHVTLNEDDTVPPALQVPLSTTRPINDSEESISEEMMDLIGGLLDVRIPERLGSVDRFEAFSGHSAFLQYGYHSAPHRTSPSPVLEEDQAGVFVSHPTPEHPSFPFPAAASSPPLASEATTEFNILLDKELDSLRFIEQCA
jgi:hypothetical protein